MRYIKIISKCEEFDNHISENIQYISGWDIPTDVKTILHNHLLKQQQGLCVYCQREIKAKKSKEELSLDRHIVSDRISMIEHIRPKDKKRFPDLIYCYFNLAVACKKEKKGDIEYCEDKKDNEYNVEFFLNPLEDLDIEQYFGYDAEGTIFPKNGNEKSQYMIETVLNLNNDVLNLMRKETFKNYFEMIMTDESIKDILLDEQQEQLPEFYSMLKYLFP